MCGILTLFSPASLDITVCSKEERKIDELMVFLRWRGACQHFFLRSSIKRRKKERVGDYIRPPVIVNILMHYIYIRRVARERENQHVVDFFYTIILFLVVKRTRGLYWMIVS
jgi:hypothetical protein